MRIFVYGSLKRGYALHHFLEGQEFIHETRTTPHFRIYDVGGYPGLIEVSSEGRSIHGEIWEISDACLQSLDRMEGVDEGLYERKAIALLSPDEEEPTEAYFYLRKIVPDNDRGDRW